MRLRLRRGGASGCSGCREDELLAGFRAHHEGVFGAEGDFGLGDDGVVGEEVQAPALRDGG